METAQRRAPDEGDARVASEEEEEDEIKATKVLKMLAKVSGRPKVEIPLYDENINVEELMDWISSLDKYFNYEEVDDKKKVKFAVTRLRVMQLSGGMNYKHLEKGRGSPRSNNGIKW